MNRITEKLITDAQHGDEYSLNYILDIISKHANYQSYKRLNNREDIDDCVQCILLKVAANLHKYNYANEYFIKWVNAIIDNECKNVNRTNTRLEYRISIENEYVDDYSDEGLSPEQETSLSHLERYLGEQDYKLIYYKLKCKYNFEELAEIFDCSLSTIKRRYQKALKDAMSYMEVKDED